MFVEAINRINPFTKPVKFIHRNYKSSVVVPGAATLFFINDEGYALTCAHVAREIIHAEQLNRNYQAFRQEAAALKQGKKDPAGIRFAERRYNLSEDKPAQMKVRFDWLEPEPGRDVKIDFILSESFDIAVLHFRDYKQIHHKGHAVFAKDTAFLQPGKMLCRSGYPFPEFRNFTYNAEKDDIEWTKEGQSGTPVFPIEGMMTRQLADKEGRIYGIEMSTPGLRGQSGGPLYNEKGIICGMQSATNHLHLGFDMKNEKRMINGKTETVSNQPFLHVGHCVHVDRIKEFLDEKHIKYDVE